jgi:hypothetical protein
MKFASAALQGAAAKAQADPKGQAGNATSSPWQKTRRGKTFPKAKSTLPANSHYVRIVIPHDPGASTEEHYKQRSLQVLTTMYEHLIHLDQSIILHESSVWLEGGPATTRAIKLPLELSKAVRDKKINKELISQFTEVHNESKRDGNTVTYLRFCMQTTRAISEIMRILSGEIRRRKSNIIVGISKTREIVDVVARWLQGCDPIFLSAPTIEKDIRNLLVLTHGEENVPSFYVKKAFESIWINQQSEKSAAPVVKVCCEASGTAALRFMLDNLEYPAVFTKFAGNNEEKAVKWALLNDHIDILNSKSYIIMRGSAITCSSEILKEKGKEQTTRTTAEV